MEIDGRDSISEETSWEAIEFQPEELSMSESIVARGQFWTCFVLGKIRPIRELPPKLDSDTTVMIKACQQNVEDMCCKGLRAEMNILFDLGHSNVLKLIGYSLLESTKVVPRVQLVFEYCANGNLRKVLQRGKPYFDGGKPYCPRKIITLEVLSPGIYLDFCGWHLLKWSTEVARGMEYLAFKGIVHRDLAARNVLISCDWTAKIGNFGISHRQKVQDFDFTDVSELEKQVLPLAWMAPESIQNLTFSEQSDVWSYAVTVWEIFTLGEVPFKDQDVENDMNFVEKLAYGIRPPRAEHADQNIWDLITSCWSFDPKMRPTFSKIKYFLERTVIFMKPQWESKLSVSGPSSKGQNEDATMEGTESCARRKKSGSATSTIHLPGTGNLLKRCVTAVDDALIRHGLKT